MCISSAVEAVELLVHDNGPDLLILYSIICLECWESETYLERRIVWWQIPQVEMVHSTINAVFAKTIQETQRDWHDKIMYALHILPPNI